MVSAIRTPASGEASGWVFVYAPGAGSNLNKPFGAYAARELAAHGVASVRFQFRYMEAGKRRPDSQAVLEATWRQVISSV